MTEEIPNDAKKDVVPSKYREQYKKTGGNCGDFIASELSRITSDSGPESLGPVKTENGIEAKRWSSFNVGMQRMNLANSLRAKYLRGETIKILGKEYNVLHQIQDYTGKYKDDDTKSIGKVAEFLDLQTNDRTIKALMKTLFSEERKAAKEAEKQKKKEEREKEKAAKAKAEAKAK